MKWMIVIIFGSCLACSTTTYHNTSLKKSFDEIFSINEAVLIQGTQDTPFFFATGPYIKDETIFFTDLFGHQVLRYNLQDKILKSFGGKGEGPGEYQLPYGIAIDMDGDLFVNDRSNSRVQKISNNGDHLKSIALQGQIEAVYLWEDESKKYLRVVGVNPCEKGTCLVRQIELTGDQDAVYAPLKGKIYNYSWKSAQSATGELFIANILSSEVAVYSSKGQLLREFKLRSPSWSLFQTKGLSSNYIRGIQKKLKSESYTMIESMHVSGNYLFVALKRVNMRMESPYVLDIYDIENGKAVCYGAESLHALGYVQDDKFWFYSKDERTNQFGDMVLQVASLKL